MKKIFIAGALLMSIPFVSFAQTTATGTVDTATTTLTDPGLVPGDFFYFLDRWSEGLNLAFTFNKEKKARKHLEYAKERVAEMKDVLKKPNAKIENVTSAKENFGSQIADAASLVKSEKDKGSDVANLARELDNELDVSRDDLKDIFKEHKDKSSRAEKEIRAKLSALTPTDPQVQGLTQALEAITKEKGDAMKEDGDIDTDLMDEQALFEEVMGKKISAQKHMEQTMRLRDRMGQDMPADFSVSSEKLMKQAQEAMKRGDFESARRMSKEAEQSLEKVREMRDVLEGGPFDGGAQMMRDGADTTEIVGELNVDDLEQELQKGERMMDELVR
ncbi:MAG: hypothetical protein HZB10_01915 [Candidatus Yonathbacteria bacterium]|nr:hypothetical protein [Candidatus Yonathbacteria bacterium]